MNFGIDMFWLDHIGHIAESVVSISALAALIIPPIRKWLVRVLTSDKQARAGIRALLRTAIIRECKKAKHNKGIYLYDCENLTDMFEQYKDLGGNHGIEKLIEEVEKLPTIMEDK